MEKHRTMTVKQFAEFDRMGNHRLKLTKRQQRRYKKLEKLEMPPSIGTDESYSDYLLRLLRTT